MAKSRKRKRTNGSDRRKRLMERHGITGRMEHAPNGRRIPIMVDGQHVADVVRIGSELNITKS